MKKYSQETLVGLFVLVGLACVGYMTVRLGDVSLLGDDRYALYSRFNSVSGLRIGNPVEMLGIEIGHVGAISLDQKSQQAVVELKLKKGTEVYDDAIASIKTAGLIGDKYVSLDPGGGGDLLKEGATITETESPVDLGDLIGKYAFGGVNKE